jgi:hypothetical protein
VSGLPTGACSLSTAAAGEPAYGSAAPAATWLAIEQPGPWGHDPVVDSHLDPALGTHLRTGLARTGGRVALLREARRHPDVRPGHRPFVAVASAVSGQTWLLSGRVDSPEALRRLDLDALSHGDAAAVAASVPGLEADRRPLLLVCTNGRRDVCCAVFGRPLAHDVSRQRPGQVWETSHTGGHRFSPTAVVLPWGVTLARLDSRLAVATLDAAAQGLLPRDVLSPEHDRGRSGVAPAGQAAESTVRARIGETSIEALRTDLLPTGEEEWAATVRHADGRHWRAKVRRGAPTGLRAAACGRAPEPYTSYDVTFPEHEPD